MLFHNCSIQAETLPIILIFNSHHIIFTFSICSTIKPSSLIHPSISLSNPIENPLKKPSNIYISFDEVRIRTNLGFLLLDAKFIN